MSIVFSCYLVLTCHFVTKYDKYMTNGKCANMCSFWVSPWRPHPADRRFSYGHFSHATWTKNEACPRRARDPGTPLEQSNLHFTHKKMTLRFRFAIVAHFHDVIPNIYVTPLPVVYGLIHIQSATSIGQLTSPVLGSGIVQTHSNRPSQSLRIPCWESYHMKHPPPLRYTICKKDRESREIESR